MPEPFELVSTGMNLASQGKFNDAIKHILQGIDEYEKLKDLDGVAYALGRLGDCYEQANEIDKAGAAYERAVQIGTDIPAIYSGLIGILVSNSSFDRAFQIAEIWQKKGAQHLSYPAHHIFIGLSSNLTRQGRHQDAHDLLKRAILFLPKQKHPDIYWSARGRLGQVFEKSGDLDKAIQLYQQAIAEGSPDRTTYTRCLINLERLKQYDEALKVIKKGLRIQNDAAWEADLRKRQQRTMRKSGVISKGTPKAIIPDFSVRKGKKFVTLIQQIQFSPQLFASTCIGDRVYGVTGGKSPKLLAHDLGGETNAWRVDLPLKPTNILAGRKHIILYARDGSVGSGQTQIFFYDLNGKLAAQQRLPDVPSDIVARGDRVYAGCRNGKLYAFSTDGKSLWSYTVPGSEEEPESPYFRPCPYYVSAGADVVAFSSFENVFALNPSGKLLYRWNTPERQETTDAELFTMTISSGPSPIRGLCAAESGKQVLIASDDGVIELAGGRVVRRVKPKVDVINSISIAPSGALWAISAADKVILVENGKLTGSFRLKGPGRVQFNQMANRIIGWAGKYLAVATYKGTLISEVEFVKNIHFVNCKDDAKLVVGTRFIIHLDTTAPRDSQAPSPTKPKSTKDKPMELRPQEEAGIPVVWIKADKLSVGPGKAVYQGPQNKEYTIEQVALEHYRSKGYQGSWTENAYWWKGLALLFWDVIFARIPGAFSAQFGAFPSEMQDMPLDLFKPEFFIRRKALIDKRIRTLTSPRFFGLVKTSVGDELKKVYKHHYGKPCRLIEDWERYSLDALLFSINALNRNQLMMIMRRLLENFNENRRGLPDLVIADSSGKPGFVEVKAEREKIGGHQIGWMRFLQNQVGTSVEICRVVS